MTDHDDPRDPSRPDDRTGRRGGDLGSDDAEIRRIVRATAVDTTPPPGARDRVLAATLAEWDEPGSAPDAADRVERGARSRRTGVMLAVAAVSVLVVGGLGVVVFRSDVTDPATELGPTEPAPSSTAPGIPTPSSTVVPTTVPGSTALPEETVSTMPEPAVTPTTGPPPTAAPIGEVPVGEVPVGFADWPAASPPGDVTDLVALLPDEPVPGGVDLVRSGFVDTGVVFESYEQLWLRPEDGRWVQIRTQFGGPDDTPADFRSDDLDVGAWSQPWVSAYLVDDAPGVLQVRMNAAEGYVTIRSNQETEQDLERLAASLIRRPVGEPGWVPVVLDAGVESLAEGDGATAVRGLVVKDAAGETIAQLDVFEAEASVYTSVLTETSELVVVEVGEVAGLAIVDEFRVSIVWPLGDGSLARYVRAPSAVDAGDDPAETALRQAESFVEVDTATWESATREFTPSEDGCQTLVC